jgi:hypothetical protein
MYILKKGFFEYIHVTVCCSCRQIIVVFRFPNGKFKSIWWMPRLIRSDEGRGLATICFGEVPSNL